MGVPLAIAVLTILDSIPPRPGSPNCSLEQRHIPGEPRAVSEPIHVRLWPVADDSKLQPGSQLLGSELTWDL